jgi:Protein of unknown function (DUF1156)
MIPKECKWLAKVDFSIAVVSRHPAREKSIRHRHPSTLHLWWARRPARGVSCNAAGVQLAEGSAAGLGKIECTPDNA